MILVRNKALLISGLVRIDGSNQQYTANKEIWCYGGATIMRVRLTYFSTLRQGLQWNTRFITVNVDKKKNCLLYFGHVSNQFNHALRVGRTPCLLLSIASFSLMLFSWLIYFSSMNVTFAQSWSFSNFF